MSALDGQIAPVTGSTRLTIRSPRSPIMAVNQAAMRRRARIMHAVNVPMRAALSLPFATPLSTSRTRGDAAACSNVVARC